MLYRENGQYVRAEKKKALSNSYTSVRRLESEDIQAAEYLKGVIIPVRQGAKGSLDYGGVVTNEGIFVKSSMIPGWVTGWYDDYQCVESDQTAVYCGRMIGHWGHFLLECATRLWYFLEHDDRSYIYVFIVREGNSPPIEGNFRQFFDLLGIWDRLVFLNQATRYQRVVVPDRSFQYKNFYSPKYISVFDRVVNNALDIEWKEAFSKKLFLSRSCFERARESEAGLDMLQNYFEKNGYEVIYPENVPLSKLIHKLQSAQECASESGTAAHNFLFCKTGQDVIVAERQSVVNEAQVSIDITRRLNTVYVDSHLTLDYKTQPCFLYYTSYMQRITMDRGYLPPDPSFISIEYLRDGFVFYKNACQKMLTEASSNVIFSENEMRCLDEAVHDSRCTLETLGVPLALSVPKTFRRNSELSP